jgi:hypothetical protein
MVRPEKKGNRSEPRALRYRPLRELLSAPHGCPPVQDRLVGILRCLSRGTSRENRAVAQSLGRSDTGRLQASFLRPTTARHEWLQ